MTHLDDPVDGDGKKRASGFMFRVWDESGDGRLGVVWV